MPTIGTLGENEKLFMAGCLKSIIIADGSIGPEELSDLDKILEIYNFSDYDTYLEKFEKEIRDEVSFWNLAESITEDSVRNQILSILQELSLQEGYQDRTAGTFLKELQETWEITE
jgi:hypothetical protein